MNFLTFFQEPTDKAWSLSIYAIALETFYRMDASNDSYCLDTGW